MRKPIVDQKKCIGCGLCAILAPKTFMLGKNGKAQVTKCPADKPQAIREAIKNCPVQAISLPA